MKFLKFNFTGNKVIFFALMLLPCTGFANDFSWQKPYAKVLPEGDLEWAPQPFKFVVGKSIRYIDYENGKDLNDGRSKSTPWKHHPWDKNAGGKSKDCRGIHTYVFKGGVYYRGAFEIKEAGKSSDPIKLTRDPSWGKGEAVICGSEIVTNWKKGVDRKDIPEPQKVWYADLDYSPRAIWMVKENGKAVRIPLARMPNWKISNPDYVRSEWWIWTGPTKWNTDKVVKNGEKMHLCSDRKNLKGKPKELFEDATIWSERSSVTGLAYPGKVAYIDTDTGSLGFFGWHRGTRGASGLISNGAHYFLENKPQYLDDPNGEYWFDKKNNGGRIYLRLPHKVKPENVRIEVAKRGRLIYGDAIKHLYVSGLTFLFTGAKPENIYRCPLDFSVKPFYGFLKDANPGCIHLLGSGEDIRIANCNFRDVYQAIHFRADRENNFIDKVLIEDNNFKNIDHGGINLKNSFMTHHVRIRGRIGNVKIYRNCLFNIGHRGLRYQLASIEVNGAETAEIAGNIVQHSYQQGINVLGAKGSGCWGEEVLSRILVHHNKVYNSMLDNSDYGGIETWQGGPFYVFNNLVYNAQGMWKWQLVREGKSAGFGHAYYLDGSFKNYFFNNIAWGKSNDTKSVYANCSAFQEIIGYENAIFNNTIYNYVIGSRRQAPAGYNKYLGNLWSCMSEQVFRHGEPTKISGGGNAHDVGVAVKSYRINTNAYYGNVFYNVKKLGCTEPYPGKGWNVPEKALLAFEGFKKALKKDNAMMSELGVVSKTKLLQNPANGDFRPAKGAKYGRRAKVFVPWGLSKVVGEWNFYHIGGNPSNIIDEHWFSANYYNDRKKYRTIPMYPLTAINCIADDYVKGPLENWVAGALRINPAKKQYAVLSNAKMMESFTYKGKRKSRFEGGKMESITVRGEEIKNPQIYKGNMLIEIYFKTVSSDNKAILTEKMDKNGYSLTINRDGKVEFTVKGEGQNAGFISKTRISDDKWHHVIAEVDRESNEISIYLDGKLNVRGKGIGKASLANNSDFFVGGSPSGRYLNGTLEFLRIAQGTLKDAKTSIEELYAWEFNGPFLRDFAGYSPRQRQANAGALLAEEVNEKVIKQTVIFRFEEKQGGNVKWHYYNWDRVKTPPSGGFTGQNPGAGKPAQSIEVEAVKKAFAGRISPKIELPEKFSKLLVRGKVLRSADYSSNYPQIFLWNVKADGKGKPLFFKIFDAPNSQWQDFVFDIPASQIPIGTKYIHLNLTSKRTGSKPVAGSVFYKDICLAIE